MTEASRTVVVWDAPTRLFHWLTAALVAAAYATWRLNWMAWHAWAGDALLALLLFRVAWGFFGSETARFSRFVASPRTVAEHLKFALLREPDRQVGHNPAGGWMVLLLILLLFVETLSGIYVANDIADVGPLTELVPAPAANAIDAAHAVVWDVLFWAIVLHVLAIAGYAAGEGTEPRAPDDHRDEGPAGKPCRAAARGSGAGGRPVRRQRRRRGADRQSAVIPLNPSEGSPGRGSRLRDGTGCARSRTTRRRKTASPGPG